MPCVSIAALLLLALAAPRPDFSGEWELNIAKSDFGPNYPVPKSRTDQVDHRDPNNRLFEGPKQKADQVLVFEKRGVRSRE
jgi:hypothetical protein